MRTRLLTFVAALTLTFGAFAFAPTASADVHLAHPHHDHQAVHDHHAGRVGHDHHASHVHHAAPAHADH